MSIKNLLGEIAEAYRTDKQTGIDEETDVDLEGVYRARQTGTADRSLYPAGVATVAVEHDRDGYYHVRMQDEAGAVVATGHRAQHRVAAALEGPDGYDYVASV